MNAATSLFLAAALGGGLPAEPGAADPSLYSFADVYRLTVSGAAPSPAPAQGGGVRLAAAPASAAEPRFSISSAQEPQPWTLILSGLALAGWVAHRRLVHPL